MGQNMRVITGTARGRKLQTIEGTDVRPTTEMVKEAVFSMIQFEVAGARVLDLFAGSGQMGIEALSRDASFGVFVDMSRQAQAVIRDNLQTTGLGKQSRVVAMDSLDFLRTTAEAFDIAFLDPPYSKGLLEKALELLPAKMTPAGVIICENPRGEAMPETAGAFTVRKQYRYGKIQVTTYRGEVQA